MTDVADAGAQGGASAQDLVAPADLAARRGEQVERMPSRVLLPAPFGPSTAATRPGSNCVLTLARARRPAVDLANRPQEEAAAHAARCSSPAARRR